MPNRPSVRDRLIAWLANTEPARREIMLASLVLAAVLAVGTVGYHLVEGWTLLDGLYMTFITLTTIGFTEVHTLSDAGRIFTVVVAIAGIGLVAFIATRSAQLLVTGPNLRETHLKRRLRQMQDHYILCGHGRIGRRMAADLKRADYPFVVVDHKEEAVQDLDADHIPWVVGEAEEEDTLQRAGIDRARGLILTLPEDSANIFVTLVARDLNPDVFILARTSDVKNQRRLLHAGADKVIAPDEVGADRMAQVILKPNVDRFMELILQTGMLGLNMEEVTVQEDSGLAGKTLAESNFRQQFDAVVVAILEADSDEMRFNPSPTYRIEPGDVLIVLGNREMINRLRREGCEA